MYTFLLSISYDGSQYSGWAQQKNDNVVTVEGTIIRVLRSSFKAAFQLKATSRTDKKVHSYDQKIKLTFNFAIDTNRLQKILNRNLPADIYVNSCIAIDSDFNLQQACQLKNYQYKINCGSYNPFQQRYAYQYNKLIKRGKLQKIANLFVGTHDFYNFSAIKTSATNSIRIIKKIKVKKYKKMITIDFYGPGFIMHQIRMIVGTMLACYENKITPLEIRKKLENCNHNKTPYKVTGAGLYLVKIKY